MCSWAASSTSTPTVGTGAQLKEAGTAPGRTGGGPREGGEPQISVWNGQVPLAPVFAQEHGAGLEAPGLLEFTSHRCSCSRYVQLKPADKQTKKKGILIASRTSPLASLRRLEGMTAFHPKRS